MTIKRIKNLSDFILHLHRSHRTFRSESRFASLCIVIEMSKYVGSQSPGSILLPPFPYSPPLQNHRNIVHDVPARRLESHLFVRSGRGPGEALPCEFCSRFLLLMIHDLQIIMTIILSEMVGLNGDGFRPPFCRRTKNKNQWKIVFNVLFIVLFWWAMISANVDSFFFIAPGG